MENTFENNFYEQPCTVYEVDRFLTVSTESQSMQL